MQHNHDVISTGTSNFVSLRAARTYYARLDGLTHDDVAEKIREGAITIGMPNLKPGQRCKFNKEGRYIVTELARPTATA